MDTAENPNWAWKQPENDESQFEDSSSDHDYDYGDEKTWQARTRESDISRQWKHVESEYFYILFSKFRIYSDLTTTEFGEFYFVNMEFV